jgi:hypothetical protein
VNTDCGPGCTVRQDGMKDANECLESGSGRKGEGITHFIGINITRCATVWMAHNR